MSHLVCNNCGNDMGEYIGDVINISKCTKCGSENLTRLLILSDHVDFHENVKGKSSRMPGKKKPSSEFQAGEEWSVGKQRYVSKVRKIDRENDEYYEKVSDTQMGEIIHECAEPLSQHFGHGSAKFTEKGPNELGAKHTEQNDT